MGTVREDVMDQLVAIWETLIDSWNDFVLFVQETWPMLTVLLIMLVGAIWIADPAPPRRVVMATGPTGSYFEKIGQQYAKYFAERGITLELVATEGSVENLKHLQEKNDPIMVAFVQAGVAEPQTPGIQTLGSINYQPLWCFYRGANPISEKHRYDGWLHTRLNVGTPNSGTHLLSEKLLALNRLDLDRTNFKMMPTHEAIAALQAGSLDAMCVVDAYDSPNIQKLLKMDGLQLANFERAEAYARLVSSIEQVTIPEGSLDLANNYPQSEMTLISPTTELVIDERLHPAIQTLFLMAARSINGKESFFTKEGEFPAFMDSSLKRSHEAQVFYEKGTPLLVDYMPFWLAEFIRRLFLTMLPLFAVAYPMIRSMPNYFKNRVKGRINRLYGELKFFEQNLLLEYDPGKKTEYLTAIDGMERMALDMKVPKSVSSDYYTLRSSIDYVRNCLLRDGYNVHVQPHAEAAPVAVPNAMVADGEGDE